MDLKVSYNQLLFWVNLKQGLWYPPEELDNIVHQGQLSYFKDCFIKYGTGQRLNDALAPFKRKYTFTTDANGLLTTPDDYMDLISILPDGALNCPVVNDDEIAYRKKSQAIPMSLTRPFAEEVQNWDYQLYPNQLQTGTLTYFSIPIAPKFAYTTISGRVIIYNQAASTQLKWGDDEVQPLLIWVLRSIGINMGDKDVSEFADTLNKEDLLSTIKI